MTETVDGQAGGFITGHPTHAKFMTTLAVDGKFTTGCSVVSARKLFPVQYNQFNSSVSGLSRGFFLDRI